MRAVKFSRYGGPDVLDIVEVERPPAEADTVVVATVVAATNPGEIGIREGRFADIWPAHFPEGQGNDFAGYVAEIGSNITNFAVGDEVLGFAPRASPHQRVRWHNTEIDSAGNSGISKAVRQLSTEPVPTEESD